MEKKNIVVLFGGQSSEHVVSCMSVQNVAANINEEKYNVIPRRDHGGRTLGKGGLLKPGKG